MAKFAGSMVKMVLGLVDCTLGTLRGFEVTLVFV
jgi:hypothetical protein